MKEKFETGQNLPNSIILETFKVDGMRSKYFFLETNTHTHKGEGKRF